MPHLSIIIPLTSDVDAFEDTLASVLRHQPCDSELIVIHQENYDDPHDLELEGVKFVGKRESESTIDTLLRVAASVDSQVLHLLHGGTEVDEGWCDQPLELMNDSDVASVSPVLVYEDRPSRIAGLGMGYARTFRPLLVGHNQKHTRAATQVRRVAGPTRWAAFFRTDLMAVLAQTNWQLLDDVFDLQLALFFQRLGYQSKVASDSLIMINRSLELNHVIQTTPGQSLHQVYCQFRQLRRGLGLRNQCSACLIDAFESGFSPSVIFHSIGRFSVDSKQVASNFLMAWDQICWQVAEMDDLSANERTPDRRAA